MTGLDPESLIDIARKCRKLVKEIEDSELSADEKASAVTFVRRTMSPWAHLLKNATLEVTGNWQDPHDSAKRRSLAMDDLMQQISDGTLILKQR